MPGGSSVEPHGKQLLYGLEGPEEGSLHRCAAKRGVRGGDSQGQTGITQEPSGTCRGSRSNGRQLCKELWAPQQLGGVRVSRTQVRWRRASATPDLKDCFYGALVRV